MDDMASCGFPAQVARQLSSAASYLTQADHVMWDCHASDVIVDPVTCHLMLLDIFMQPDLMLGSPWPGCNVVWCICASALIKDNDFQKSYEHEIVWHGHAHLRFNPLGGSDLNRKRTSKGT